MSKFLLTIELVPKTSWYNNLRSLMRKEDWIILRKKVVMDAKNICAICRSKGYLQCHEVWHYDDENHIQRLIGLLPICDLCHAVKHIGHTESTSKTLYAKAVEHFLSVNKCKRLDFEQQKNEAYLIWEERSKYEWRIDIGEYEGVNYY